MKGWLALGACAAAASSLSAQTPRPTTADFHWLAGNWEGNLTGRPGTTDMTFTDPRQGTITGIMRLADNGKIVVVELISLVDTPDGVEMRFRHFSPALEAYETQFKQAMRLSSHSDDRDVFANTAPYDKDLMSTQPRTTQFIRRGPDEFVGRSDIIGDDGRPAIVESVYRRRK
jgi:hypothetical protein